MLRAAALACLCALAACGPQSPPPAGDAIECALGGAQDFTPDCRYEVSQDGRQAVIWHPDGGFRRFDLLPGGAGLASSDGAEQVIQGIMGGKLEVSVGQDRYRLPTVPALP